MTTLSLITKVRRLLQYDLDLTPDEGGADATDETIVQSINEAQDRMGALCPILDPALAFTLPVVASGPCTVDLSTATAKRVVKVTDVCLSGGMLYTRLGSKPGPWSMAELEGDYPGWRSETPSKPLLWARLSDRSMLLYPAPDASQPSSGNYVSALCLPAQLDSAVPAGVPELPVELHEWLAKLAASIEATPVATENSQFAKIAAWEKGALEAAEKKGIADRSARSPLGSTTGRFRGDRMWI